MILALYYWLALWLFGTGVGLILSVVTTLVPEISIIVKMISLPLLILSGVIFPLNFIPHEYLQYLLYNPLVHGLELLRSAFFAGYHTVPGVDGLYLAWWVLGSVSLGLLLHLSLAKQLIRQ